MKDVRAPPRPPRSEISDLKIPHRDIGFSPTPHWPTHVYYSPVAEAPAHSRQNLHVWISMSLCRTPHAEQRASQLRGSNVLRSPCRAASHLPSSASSAPVRASFFPQASSLPCATSSSNLQCACSKSG